MLKSLEKTSVFVVTKDGVFPAFYMRQSDCYRAYRVPAADVVAVAVAVCGEEGGRFVCRFYEATAKVRGRDNGVSICDVEIGEQVLGQLVAEIVDAVDRKKTTEAERRRLKLQGYIEYGQRLYKLRVVENTIQLQTSAESLTALQALVDRLRDENEKLKKQLRECQERLRELTTAL